MKASGLSTEDRIVQSATKLFGEHGFDGVSLREVLKNADANIASAHYYFGSKHDLFLSVTKRFFSKIASERMSNLDEVKATSGFTLDAVEQILRGYIEPHYNVALEPNGVDYLRVLSRFQSESKRYSRDFFSDHFGESRLAYKNALKKALDPIGEKQLIRGFSCFVTSMLISPFDSGYFQLAGNDDAEVNYAELSEMLVLFSASGLRALRGR